jgi:hypothetical protein
VSESASKFSITNNRVGRANYALNAPCSDPKQGCVGLSERHISNDKLRAGCSIVFSLDSQVEVFNILFIREQEKRHVVHCMGCARKQTPSLQGFVCLEEYKLSELTQIYDAFVLHKTPAGPPLAPATTTPPPMAATTTAISLPSPVAASTAAPS